MPDNDAFLRDQLVELLHGGNAHVDVLTALKGFPPKLYGAKPENSPHSAWELLEHMRIALRDLWDFSTNAEYVEKNWPDDYWPATAEPPSKEAWHNSVRALKEDLDAFEQADQEPEKQSLRADSVGQEGSDVVARISAGCRSHQLPHRGIGFPASPAWRLEELKKVSCRSSLNCGKAPFEGYGLEFSGAIALMLCIRARLQSGR